MINVAVIFVCTALISGAVSMQIRNNMQCRYFMVALTSMFIGSLNLTLLKTIPHITTISEGAAYIIGGMIGSLIAVIVHKRIFNK